MRDPPAYHLHSSIIQIVPTAFDLARFLELYFLLFALTNCSSRSSKQPNARAELSLSSCNDVKSNDRLGKSPPNKGQWRPRREHPTFFGNRYQAPKFFDEMVMEFPG